MTEKYKLRYWDRDEKVLSIRWAGDRTDYVPGDCRVLAIKESTQISQDQKSSLLGQKYTAPMTLDELREYIVKNAKMLGSLIHNCVGINLEDICEAVEFEKPIEVRSK